MIRYYRLALAAHFRQGRILYFLTVLGVALGVAAVLAIQIINRSAVGAFRGSVQAISSDADLSILGKSGPFPEEVFLKALDDPSVERAWPIVRSEVRVESDSGSFFLDIYGLDLTAPMRIDWRGEADQLGAALSQEGWIAVSTPLARRMGWRAGDRFEATLGVERLQFRIGALIDIQRYSPQASSKLAVMDIAQLQHLQGGRGTLHQIDLRLRREGGAARSAEPPPAQTLRAARDRLQDRLGPSLQVLSLDDRENQARDLLGAFRLNLTALSLISLFVGLFLIYASTQASLVRRRAEFGLLRSLGASRRQVLGLILGEVTLLALLGVALGVPLGYWLATLRIDLVSATISNIYLLNEIESVQAPPQLLATAASIGVLGALLGALLPAWDMSRRHPRDLLSAITLREGISAATRPLAALGLGLLTATGAWYLAWGQGWKPAGFVLGIGLLAAIPMASPLAVKAICSRVRLRGFGLSYSVRTLSLQLQKTSTAVATLSIAVCMLIGITLMIGSFRKTVETWMSSTVQADVYVAAESWRGGARSDARLSDDLVKRMADFPGVEAIDRLRSRQVYSGPFRIGLAGVDVALPGGEQRFPLMEGDMDAAYRSALEGGVFISEPLARRSGLGVGDPLPLTVPWGEAKLPVAGIYYDYASERGAAVVDWSTYQELFGPGPPSNVALYLAAGIDAEASAEQLRQAFSEYPLRFNSNRRLRRMALEIFDQTFAVVRILQAMSLLIAVCGITLTLLILARERVSELALYRALGARRLQIFAIFVGKGLGMALLALLLGTIGGLALAAILIYVINRDYFGWTIQAHWPWASLAAQVASIFAAALLAAVYPALRASRTPAAELAKDDS